MPGSDDPGPQTKHIHIVMFNPLMGAVDVMTDTGSDARKFIGRNGHPDPGSAKHNRPVRLLVLIAFILARPFEEALRQALVGPEGGLSVFLFKPIALGFLILTAVSVWITIRRSLQAKKERTLK